MELEWHQLEMKYEGLRIVDCASQARLTASLVEQGQLSPVLVVKRAEEGGYVLIDGYRRAAALGSLGRDTVRALVLKLSEEEALILHHRLEHSRRRSALEEGWLLRELRESHGFGQQELARRLWRSPSWVSRRLALVEQLPDPVQQRVRQGKLCAHAAERYLVPLARANVGQLEHLVEGVGQERLSSRQVEKLYRGWRAADREGRERIVKQPLLYLKMDEELCRAEPSVSGKQWEQALLRDIEALGGISRRLRRRLKEGVGKGVALNGAVRSAWLDSRLAFDSLCRQIED